MPTVVFLLMSEKNGNADHGPFDWGGTVALTEALKLDLDDIAVKVLGISICCPEEVFHLLNCCEHGLNGLLRHPKGLEDQRCDGVGNSVITVCCVNQDEAGCNSGLADNVIKKNLGQRFIV